VQAFQTNQIAGTSASLSSLIRARAVGCQRGKLVDGNSSFCLQIEIDSAPSASLGWMLSRAKKESVRAASYLAFGAGWAAQQRVHSLNNA
jgi:hypothetical protein